MIAQNNEILTSATKSLFEYNADDLIRQQCRAREEAERHERTLLKKISDQEKLLEKKDELLNAKDELLEEKDAQIKLLKEQLSHALTNTQCVP